ncbi:MAG: TonB-dependent receptor [Saprospiraceae bacterium]|nr:TonB-dependent receptor [Saprospiraceae bacterium]
MTRIFILLLVLSHGFLFAQNTWEINGVITDSVSNTPLNNVNVYVKTLNTGDVTNKKGEFSISNLRDGNYTIHFSCIGYLPQEKQIVIKGENQLINIKLKRKIYDLDGVTVTTYKYEELQKIPARINIITVENIKNSSELSMTEILGNISGVNVENTLGVYASSAVVSLRGISGDDQSRTLVLIDGIPINKSDGGSVNWNIISKENIEAIKIIKGPGSAKYGSNAMGGVIDIITKKPTKKFSGIVQTEYSTYNTLAGSLNLSGVSKTVSDNSFYWGIMGTMKKSDGYITELEEYIEVDDSIIVPVFLNEINSNVILGYNLNNKHNFEFFANYFDDKRGNGIHVFDDFGAYSEHDTWFSVLKYKYDHKNFNIKSDVFYLNENYQRVYEYMKEGEYMFYDVDSKRQDKGANIDFSLVKNQHKFSSGTMFKQGSVDATDTYYTSTDLISNEGEMNLYSVYIQDEIDFKSKNIQLNIGLRYDFADFNNALFSVEYPSYSIEFMTDYQDTVLNPHYWSQISPKLSAQKRFNERTRVYLAYGKGFKAPLLDDLCRTSKSYGSFKLANPNLKPEIIDNFEIGVDYTVFKKLSIKHSVYYSIGKNFMYLISTGDSVNMGYKISPIYTIDNISKVNIYGIETDIEYPLKNSLTTYFNYTYNISQIKEHKTNNSKVDEDLSNKYLTNIPVHKFVAGLFWKNKILNVGLSGKYIGSRWVNDLNEVDEEYLLTDKFPSYTIFNIKLQHELFKGFSMSVSINNIFDKIYVNNKLQRCPGRTITGQLTFRF